jgi:hypothetical protein
LQRSSAMPSQAPAGRVRPAGRLACGAERADQKGAGRLLSGRGGLRVTRVAAGGVVAAEVALLQRLAVGVVLEAGFVLDAASLFGEAGGAGEARAGVAGIVHRASARRPCFTPVCRLTRRSRGLHDPARAGLATASSRAASSAGSALGRGSTGGPRCRRLGIVVAARADGESDRPKAERCAEQGSAEQGAAAGGQGFVAAKRRTDAIEHAPTIASAKMGVRCAFGPFSSSRRCFRS